MTFFGRSVRGPGGSTSGDRQTDEDRRRHPFVSLELPISRRFKSSPGCCCRCGTFRGFPASNRREQELRHTWCKARKALTGRVLGYLVLVLIEPWTRAERGFASARKPAPFFDTYLEAFFSVPYFFFSALGGRRPIISQPAVVSLAFACAMPA